MKALTKALTLTLIVLLSIIFFTSPTNATYLRDLVMTGTDGPWTDVRSYSSISDAITAIGSDKQTLLIPTEVTCTSLTIPSNVTLKFTKDGAINNSGQLTIQTKDIVADSHQIFTGSGDIDFADTTKVKASWFGSLDSAISLTNDDGVRLVIDGQYTLSSSQTLGTEVILVFPSPDSAISTNAGATLSNISNIESGKHVILTGDGDFDFVEGSTVHSSWFTSLRRGIAYIDDDDVNLTMLVDGNTDIDSDTTTDEYINLKVEKGNPINISAGVILTINGPFEAGLYQVFSGDGLVDLGDGMVTEAYAAWWGVVGDGLDSSGPTNSAGLKSACISNPKKLILPNGIIKLSEQWVIDAEDLSASGSWTFHIEGQGQYDTILEPTSTYTTAEPLVYIKSNYPTVYWILSYFGKLGIKNSAGYGLQVQAPFTTVFELYVYGNKGGGIIQLAPSNSCVFRDIFISENNSDVGVRDKPGFFTAGGNTANTTLDHVSSVNQGVGIQLGDGTTIPIAYNILFPDVSACNTGINLKGVSQCYIEKPYVELLTGGYGIKIEPGYTTSSRVTVIGGKIDGGGSTAVPIYVTGYSHYIDAGCAVYGTIDSGTVVRGSFRGTQADFRTNTLLPGEGDWDRYMLRSSLFKWTASGGGDSSYYLELASGGDPGIAEPTAVNEKGVRMTKGTLGSLATGEWAYGDNDALGYNTIYVRLSTDTTPMKLTSFAALEAVYASGQGLKIGNVQITPKYGSGPYDYENYITPAEVASLHPIVVNGLVPACTLINDDTPDNQFLETTSALFDSASSKSIYFHSELPIGTVLKIFNASSGGNLTIKRHGSETISGFTQISVPTTVRILELTKRGNGGGSATWEITNMVGYRSGSGSPAGAVTPWFVGEEYLDTSTNTWYKSYGNTNADWTSI